MTASPEMTVERALTEARRALNILERNLWHQTEKCEDAVQILRALVDEQSAPASLPPQPAGAERAERREIDAAIEAAAEAIWDSFTGSRAGSSYKEAGDNLVAKISCRDTARTAITKALPFLSLPREPGEAWRGTLRTIMSECADDFHVCSKCGHQDDNATRESNLYLLLDELQSSPPSEHAGQKLDHERGEQAVLSTEEK